MGDFDSIRAKLCVGLGGFLYPQIGLRWNLWEPREGVREVWVGHTDNIWYTISMQCHSPDVVCVGTVLIHISNIVWENRAAVSLSLAAKTMVPFNASFHKSLSSKHCIFGTRQSARTGGVLFLLHVMRHRETWRTGGELRVFYGAPEQNQTWRWFRKVVLITLGRLFW